MPITSAHFQLDEASGKIFCKPGTYHNGHPIIIFPSDEQAAISIPLDRRVSFESVITDEMFTCGDDAVYCVAYAYNVHHRSTKDVIDEEPSHVESVHGSWGD